MRRGRGRGRGRGKEEDGRNGDRRGKGGGGGLAKMEVGEKRREGRRVKNEGEAEGWWKRCRNKGGKINAQLCTNLLLHSEYILEFAHWL